MDNESKMAFIQCMKDTTEHIDELDGYILTVVDSEDILVSASGNIHDLIAMLKCIIDNATQEMDVEAYSHLGLELTVYIRRLMEQRYRSDSELKEK